MDESLCREAIKAIPDADFVKRATRIAKIKDKDERCKALRTWKKAHKGLLGTSGLEQVNWAIHLCCPKRKKATKSPPHAVTGVDVTTGKEFTFSW